MKVFGLVTFLVFGSVSLFSQEKASATSLVDDMNFYADIMINALEPSTRVRAAQTFDNLFQDYLEKDNSFEKEEVFHKYISVLDAPDDDFRLISWLIKGDQEQYDFRGFISRPNGEHISFHRTTEVTEELVYSQSTDKEWYGCLYYRIMKGERDGEYIVFGFDPNGMYDNQKLVDHMLVTNDGVTFGQEIFEDKDNRETYMNRLVLTYSSDASVNLNYNVNMKMIVHDHLAQVMGFQEGQGPTHIPDGTYEGYFLENGKWLYKEKLFNHVYKDGEAPRPKPVFHESNEEDKSK